MSDRTKSKFENYRKQNTTGVRCHRLDAANYILRPGVSRFDHAELQELEPEHRTTGQLCYVQCGSILSQGPGGPMRLAEDSSWANDEASSSGGFTHSHRDGSWDSGLLVQE
jgi:hypothetical protein